MTTTEAIKVALDCMQKCAQKYAVSANLVKMTDGPEGAKGEAAKYARIVTAMQKLEELKYRQKKDPPKVPNPGSDAALDLGCSCPVLDNNHGRGISVNGEILFWINEGCPVHGNKDKSNDNDKN